jgi:hypothetical protein
MATKKAATAATPSKTTKKPVATKKAAGKVTPKAKPNATPKKRGRPSTYSHELGAEICLHIADGKTIRDIASMETMPAASTIMQWLDGRHPEFTEQYARAREALADRLAFETLTIADDGSNDTYKDDEGNVRTDHDVIARSRLRVDARKWLAAKMAPKKYGDKMAIGGADDLGPVQTVTKEMTDAERAVRLSRLVSGNPDALAALAAALKGKQ